MTIGLFAKRTDLLLKINVFLLCFLIVTLWKKVKHNVSNNISKG